MKFARFHLLLLAMGLLAVIITWGPHTPSNHLATHAMAAEYLQHYEWVQYQTDGALGHEFSGTRWHYHPETLQSTVSNPALTIYTPTQTWTLRARNATAFHSSQTRVDKVTLHHQVEISRKSDAQTNFNLKTEQLNYYPPTKQMDTPLAVTLSQPGTTTTGIGLTGSLQDETLSLLHQVTTRYVPYDY